MRVAVAEVLHAVLRCGDARQALVVDVHTQWVHARHQYVDAQVELAAVDQVRSGQVALHDDLLLAGQFQRLLPSHHLDALATARSARLHNPHTPCYAHRRAGAVECLVGLAVAACSDGLADFRLHQSVQRVSLSGQNKCFGMKVKHDSIGSVHPLHCVECASQPVLAPDTPARREVVDLLEAIQLFHLIRILMFRPQRCPILFRFCKSCSYMSILNADPLPV